MTDYKDEIRERADLGVESLLREYGATGVQVLNRRKKVVDFRTPFPGDQPIASGLEIEDGKVTGWGLTTTHQVCAVSDAL